jgi:DNA-binding NarL/FixJ family response regulator
MGIDLPRDLVTLVIDDHDAVRTALCEWVAKSFDQCRVRAARSVEEALPIMETEAVDVVLMDLQLPGMNGIEGTRAVRKRSPQTHVILVSNHDDDVRRAAAKHAGASAFVSKRAIRNELVTILSSLLLRSRH